MHPLTVYLTVITSISFAKAENSITEAEKLFALSVKPLLAEKCFDCHGGTKGKKPKGALDLTTKIGLFKGGETSKSIVVPNNPEASLLLTAIRWADEDYEMPPKAAERLSEAQINKVEEWILGGAPWPEEAKINKIVTLFSEGIKWPTSGGLTDDWTNRLYKPEALWAYRKRSKPLPPTDHRKNPVDAFINKKLAELGINPGPPASPRDLIRRMTFDLHGLPPTPKEVDGFTLADRSQTIERLLDSPRYGEQYGRHWLDIVRYADSAGLANDFERPNAWRYRDYVIRSFNSDKPYDEFIRDQIAGDEFDPENQDAVIATGFLRMGPWEQTGMSVSKITRQQWLDDVTDSVGQTFLAQALQCARCHDHKFDPIPTRDYYSIQATFATTQFADLNVPWMAVENLNGMKEDRRYHQMRLEDNAKVLEELNAKKKQGALKTPNEFGNERIARKNNTRFKWELDRYMPIALTVYNGKTLYPKNVQGRLKVPENPMKKGILEKTAILEGGDPFSPRQPVSPGTLSATSKGLKNNQPITTNLQGRRKALANWIAHPENPLTARVMVNRIWAWHFGKGIAKNPNNFGSTGGAPSHPELLDFLANEFVANGWSVKYLHRLIMNSDAYARSTQHPKPKMLADKDPNSNYFGSFLPRRLSAEELRDSMLLVSGEINLEVGGIPARPDINLEAALQPRMIMGTFAPAYQPHPKPKQRNRRSIYAMKIRGLRDPFMEIFNQPSPEKSCEMRETSTVTPQAFVLINGQETNNRALAFAKRLMDRKLKKPATLSRIFKIALGRMPDVTELKEFMTDWDQLTEHHKQHKIAPRTFPTTVTRRAQEENTGEPFTFTEKLHIYRDYVPDLQAHQVSPETRALADLCLVLINTNEFAYID